MDAVEYKEAQAVVDRRDSRPNARGHFDGRKKHRTELGAEGGGAARDAEPSQHPCNNAVQCAFCDRRVRSHRLGVAGTD